MCTPLPETLHVHLLHINYVSIDFNSTNMLGNKKKEMYLRQMLIDLLKILNPYSTSTLV